VQKDRLFVGKLAVIRTERHHPPRRIENGGRSTADSAGDRFLAE